MPDIHRSRNRLPAIPGRGILGPCPTPSTTPGMKPSKPTPQPRPARASGYQHDFAFEFNQRLQTALREGAEPEEAGFRVMAEMADLRRELRDDLSDALLAAEADSR